jgi:hypothetical protein
VDDLARAQPVAVVPVGEARGDVDLEAAVRYYERISHGRWRPAFRRLPAVGLAMPVARYAHRGGMGQWPSNSQQLAWDALSAIADRTSVNEDVILLVPAGFTPHVWRLRRGGFPLGERRWVRRYAILPDGASVGAVAHELGHLLLGWPDLVREVGNDCLMGCASLGDEPPLPCAPLRLAANWLAPVPLGRETRVRDLGAGAPPDAGQDAASPVGHWRFRERDVLVERRGAVLLALDGNAARPLLLARIALTAGDLDRPALALVAPIVRVAGLGQSGDPAGDQLVASQGS